MRSFSLLMVMMLSLVLLAGVAAPAFADEATVKIKSVDADKNSFVATDKDGKDWTFHMGRDAKVTISDRDGKLGDLKAGDEATVTYAKEGDRLVVSSIRCKRA